MRTCFIWLGTFIIGLSSLKAQTGINTSTPTAKLEVKGTAAAASASGSASNGIVRLSEGTISGSDALDFGSNGTSYFWIQPRVISDYASNNHLLINPNGGVVSIGTSKTSNTLNVGGTMTATGTIRSSAAGQVLNTVMLNESDLSISASGVTVYNTTSTVLQTTYTPVSSSSKIFIEYHCKFDLPGSSNDDWKSYLIIGSTTIQTREGIWTLADGGGGRGASLFPISGVYSNTTGNAITIKINVGAVSSDDTFKMYPDAIMTITEVAQ